MDRVDRRHPEGCWQWIGKSHYSGYGNVYIQGRIYTTHRVMFELYYGPIPDGLDLDHICRNRICCNPEHLEPVSRRVNSLRGVGATAAHAKANHCPHGHPYEGNNLVILSHGGRDCRQCINRRSREYSARKREKEVSR